MPDDQMNSPEFETSNSSDITQLGSTETPDSNNTATPETPEEPTREIKQNYWSKPDSIKENFPQGFGEAMDEETKKEYDKFQDNIPDPHKNTQRINENLRVIDRDLNALKGKRGLRREEKLRKENRLLREGAELQNYKMDNLRTNSSGALNVPENQESLAPEQQTNAVQVYQPSTNVIIPKDEDILMPDKNTSGHRADLLESPPSQGDFIEDANWREKPAEEPTVEDLDERLKVVEGKIENLLQGRDLGELTHTELVVYVAYIEERRTIENRQNEETLQRILAKLEERDNPLAPSNTTGNVDPNLSANEITPPQVSGENLERRKWYRDTKKWALIAGVVAGGATGLIGGLPATAVAGGAVLAGRILTEAAQFFSKRNLPYLSTELQRQDLAPEERARLEKLQRRWTKVDNIAEHTKQFLTGGMYGLMASSFISGVFFDGQGVFDAAKSGSEMGKTGADTLGREVSTRSGERVHPGRPNYTDIGSVGGAPEGLTLNGDWFDTTQLGWDTNALGWKGPNLYVPTSDVVPGGEPWANGQFLEKVFEILGGDAKEVLTGPRAGEIFDAGRRAVVSGAVDPAAQAQATVDALMGARP